MQLANDKQLDNADYNAKDSFFGRRRGKALRSKQQNLLDNLLPKLLINLDNKPPINLLELFQGSNIEIHLEIGFGGGEHLVHNLTLCPKTVFIGVEPFINGMAKLLSQIENDSDKQQRLRLFNQDAGLLLDWLPDNSIDSVDLFYPDPWHKKKHWKRRFINKKNLNRLARVLKNGGLFRFASDIDHYINWTLLHIKQHNNFSWIANNPDDWIKPYKNWPGTRYEAKALREGRNPTYLKFYCKK